MWNQRREATIDEVIAPDCIGYMAHGKVTGPEPFRAFWRELLALFPDLKVEIQEVMGDGDNAVVRWRLLGQATGEGFGIMSTKLPIDTVGTSWFHFRDGKIVEAWDCWDSVAAFASVRGA